MPSVTFDSVQIVDTTYIPRYVKHESASLRQLALEALSKEDGSVFVSEKYGVKRIVIAGNIKASSQTALETAIDTFKELFSRVEKNMDIGWAGSTRRYVATCVKHDFDRDYMHIGFCPWIAEFVVATGIGEDTGETTLVNAQTWTAAGSYSSAMTFLGSAEAKPRITIRTTSAAITDPKGVAVENTDTGELIAITRLAGMGQNIDFEIDMRLKTTKYNSIATSMRGVFPQWVIGANNYKIYAGEILDQAFEDDTTPVSEGWAIYGTLYAAQGFMVPVTDDTYQTISLYIKKQGTPADSCTIRIETDSSGAPSGVLAHANATLAIAVGDVPGAASWYKANFTTAFPLSANTKYWIVMLQTGDAGSAGNEYFWFTGSPAVYKRGNRATTGDSGGTWTDYPDSDQLFRLYYGGKIDTSATYSFTVYYYKRYL